MKTIPNKMVNFEDIKEQEALMLADSYPYARINCKKETGGPDCIDEVLSNAIDDYRDFLQEQIRNLDADIFVCCGNNNDNNIILNSLPKNHLHNKYYLQKIFEKNIFLFLDNILHLILYSLNQ